MMRSFYQAISGMKSMTDGLSTTGNNIANSKTTGYKSRAAQFQDLFSQQMTAAAAPNQNYAGRNPIELGNGVKLSSIAIDLTQGNIFSTGRKTDLAINGNGYFVVAGSNGQDKMFTRDGSFGVSMDNRLVASNGAYVMGWNYDPRTGTINTGAEVEPIEINLNGTSRPNQSTMAEIQGNLNATEPVGTVNGVQIPIYDSLGARHDVNMNFVKVSENPNQFVYMATPKGDFQASDSIKDIVFRPSQGVAASIQKGEYQITTSQLPNGTVDIQVVDPSGNVVASENVNDNNQTVTLSNGDVSWFTVEYVAGNAPSTAVFEVAEAGTIEFDNQGSLSNVTGSGVNGMPLIEFTSSNTGDVISVATNIGTLTGLATDSKLAVTDTDGFTAAVLRDFEISGNGVITGFFSDGSALNIGQVALATFSNPDGLSANGSNFFVETPNSGGAQIGVPGIGDTGGIISYSLENSNVDIATQLTEMMFYQKAYSANSKTIQISNQMLDVAINLIR